MACPEKTKSGCSTIDERIRDLLVFGAGLEIAEGVQDVPCQRTALGCKLTGTLTALEHPVVWLLDGLGYLFWLTWDTCSVDSLTHGMLFGYLVVWIHFQSKKQSMVLFIEVHWLLALFLVPVRVDFALSIVCPEFPAYLFVCVVLHFLA